MQPEHRPYALLAQFGLYGNQVNDILRLPIHCPGQIEGVFEYHSPTSYLEQLLQAPDMHVGLLKQAFDGLSCDKQGKVSLDGVDGGGLAKGDCACI
jgi:hypothetical protein